jgi:hypothetical protein
MNSQSAFEEEELLPGYIKNPKKIRIIRAFNLFLSLFGYGTFIINNISNLGGIFGAYRFFTIWGVTFTLITNILAQF